MKKHSQLILIGIAVLAVVGLGWSAMSGTSGATMWEDTEVACLPSGHANLALHVHPQVVVTTDGAEEAIPANMGITATCMAEVHTHDGTGVLHVESAVAGRTFSLLDFFAVWDQPFEREGYNVEILVSGEPVTDAESVIFNDLDQTLIEVHYTSEDGAEMEEEGEETTEEEVSTTTEE